MRLEKEYEKNAIKCFENKDYQNCLKLCFTCMSINPSLKWIYRMCGFTYMNLGMWSQSRGSFNTIILLETDKNLIKFYENRIRFCNDQESSD